MEPERNIEKELRAYAQRRRSEAGPSPELHPATRKLLQDEAARVSKGAAGGPSFEGWALWSGWLRLAVTAVAALAVLATGSVLLMKLSRNGTETSHAPMTLAQSKTEISTSTERQEKKLDSLSARREMNAAPLTITAAPSAAPAAPPPASIQKAPMIVLASKDRVYQPAAKSSLALGSRPPQPGTNASADFAWSSPKEYVPYSPSAPIKPVVQRFRKMSALQKTGKGSVITGASNVLASFRVEQALEKLRVIDSDGSVYTGFVERTSETGKQPAVAQDGAKIDSPQSLADGDKKKQPMRVFRFRVAGTNRTLNEEVVFTGNFLNNVASASRAPTVSNEPVGGGVVPGAASDEPPSLLELRNARVSGHVLLGKTNEVEIMATPVKR